MQELLNISIEYQYLITVSFILLLPKILLRFRIPTGITALILGCICINVLGWYKESNQLILILARLGITSLFLFAGMEIDLNDLKKEMMPLAKYLLKSIAIIIITALLIYFIFTISFQISLILTIAIFTPSAGFILSSLKHYELNDKEIFWIKLKAISKEIAAILVLFFALQMNDVGGLFRSKVIFIICLLLLPPLFKFFLNFIAPYAPKTEVSFLVIISLIFGVITKKLGTYYLVGAFATGIVAGQFNHFMNSSHSKRIEESLASFYGIFVPFYFFSAGLLITQDFFTIKGLILGILISSVFIPIRILSVVLSIKYFIKDFWQDRMKISMSLIPNLIFGLVVIGILKERFNVEAYILSGLVIYTLLASILPAIYFEKTPPENYDSSRL